MGAAARCISCILLRSRTSNSSSSSAGPGLTEESLDLDMLKSMDNFLTREMFNEPNNQLPTAAKQQANDVDACLQRLGDGTLDFGKEEATAPALDMDDELDRIFGICKEEAFATCAGSASPHDFPTNCSHSLDLSIC